MNRFTSLLRKELTEFARTWKIWVIPGLFIVLAVTGVLSARFAKELMQSPVSYTHLTLPTTPYV